MTAAEASLLPAEELISWAISTYGARRFAVVTAFQPKGMALVDMAVRCNHDVRVITVDTGRLPQATHEMIDTVRARYDIPVEVLQPQPAEVERMVALHGTNLFRSDVSLRKLCCQIRKVRPLDARLAASVDVWASGLRREQSEERAGIARLEQSPGKPVKLNPLADWTRKQVEDYNRRHHVPCHPLLAHNYATIGCEPCTRAIKPGEHERAGRWWWESEEAGKECGIHVTPDGKMKRALDVLLEEILH